MTVLGVLPVSGPLWFGFLLFVILICEEIGYRWNKLQKPRKHVKKQMAPAIQELRGDTTRVLLLMVLFPFLGVLILLDWMGF